MSSADDARESAELLVRMGQTVGGCSTTELSLEQALIASCGDGHMLEGAIIDLRDEEYPRVILCHNDSTLN